MNNQALNFQMVVGITVSAAASFLGSSYAHALNRPVTPLSGHEDNGRYSSFTTDTRLRQVSSSNTARTATYSAHAKIKPSAADDFFSSFGSGLEGRQKVLSRKDEALIWDNLDDLLS